MSFLANGSGSRISNTAGTCADPGITGRSGVSVIIITKTGSLSHSCPISLRTRNSSRSPSASSQVTAITRSFKRAFTPSSPNILRNFSRPSSSKELPSRRISPIFFSRQNAFTFSSLPLPSFPARFRRIHPSECTFFFCSTRIISLYTLRSGSGSSAFSKFEKLSRKNSSGSGGNSCSINLRTCSLMR